MRIWRLILIMLMAAAFLAPAASAAPAPLILDLQPDRHNPAAPTMGDHLRFWSTITNTSEKPLKGLVAWISLVEIDPGNEAPVDLEDWSAHKAITGATLGPAESLRTDWPMRLIKAGDYRVVVSVAERGSHTVFTSSTLQFHVRQKPVLQTTRVLPVAVGMPLLIFGLLMLAQIRRHDRKEAS